MINLQPIAILLAAYNAEKYLVEQLDSLLVQSNSDWTLYIRNDGSKDNTQSIIDVYVGKYPDKIIQIDRGGGNLGCRNNFFRLLEIVESDYYMFCDADDVWLSQKVELSYNYLKKKEQLYPNKPILVHCDAVICDEHLNQIAASFWQTTGINPDKFVKYNYIAVCCTIGGAKSIFNKAAKATVFPLANNTFIFDYWLAMNVAKQGYIFPLQKPLILYRQHSGQTLGVTVGTKNAIGCKLSKIGKLLKLYRAEARLLKSIGYGPTIKYYWYKVVTILRIRL